MHKLAKGLKKKKKSKKSKKGEEEEFDPEELERYRRERAERAERAEQKAEESGEPAAAGNAGSDEWRKFEALTAGVDSLLKKTQGDLDRIKSVSFFQRKPALDEKKPEEEEQDEEKKKSSSKKWIGFDEEGNLIEKEPGEAEGGEAGKAAGKSVVGENGFFEVPEDDDDQDDSADDDIFDTTYVDILQKNDLILAYIPDSPVKDEPGDDPFDTSNADKVLKTVDKKGNKLVSLGNAVEILSGRIDHVSTCKITPKSKRKPVVQQDLLLDDFDEVEAGPVPEGATTEPVEVQKTLLDDDSDLPDIPVDLTKLPPVLPRPVTPVSTQETTEPVTTESKEPIDITEFEILKEKTILEEIPDLDDAEFDLTEPVDNPIRLEEAEDPFGEKEPEAKDFETEIIEASFEAATFVNEEDPFDTTFADNLLPGKTELKFIEKELEELPISTVSISLTDPAGLNRDYETGFLKPEEINDGTLSANQTDLLSNSTSDLSLIDPPIAPAEEITYVDPFDTSAIKELPPGKTELKFLERELLGEQPNSNTVLVDEDDDFDPRKETPPTTPLSKAPPRPVPPVCPVKPEFKVNFENEEETDKEVSSPKNRERKASRPEVIDLSVTKSVAFELPTPSNRPDLLTTTDEEKSLPSKPLTPYYTQRSIEESLPVEDEDVDVDPFDTSFVAKVTPGKTELKLIESELLKQEPRLPHSLSDHDFDPRSQTESTRRQSDFTAASVRPANLEFKQVSDPKLQGIVEQQASSQKPELIRRESLLDAEVEVGAKPLTPQVETKTIEEEEISYVDPFDTSIATNILPGKAELKVLESELEQITEQVQIRPTPISISSIVAPTTVPDVEDFNPRAEELSESKDFLCSDEQDPGAKILTPLQSKDITLDDDIDPFDTSFATIGPGKTELKILESELMQ